MASKPEPAGSTEPPPQSTPASRRRPRAAAKASSFDPIARAFGLVASPWAAGVALAALAGLHLFKAISLAAPEGIFWVDDAPRAIALAVLITSGLGALVSRWVPAMTKRRDAGREAVAADLELSREEAAGLEALGVSGDAQSAFWGPLPLVGAALVFAALVAFAALPLTRGAGLARGGELSMSAGRPAEAAQVDMGGLKVKQNLGGLRLELMEVELGRFDAAASGATAPAAVKLRSTIVQTGQSAEAVVREGQATAVGGLEVRLARLAPTRSAAGVRVEVTDTQEEGRTFTADLLLNQRVADPKGPGTFQLTRIEPNLMGQLGLAAQGVVAEDGESDAGFWVYEDSPGHDAKHRKGRYQIAFKEVVPGYKAIVKVRPMDAPFEPTPVVALLFVVGVGLLFSSTQLSVVRRGRSVLASSVNNGEAAAWALWGGSSEATGEVEQQEGEG